MIWKWRRVSWCTFTCISCMWKPPYLARALFAHAHTFIWYCIWGTVSNFTPTPPPSSPPPPPPKKESLPCLFNGKDLTNESRLEEGLWTPEALVADGDDLTVGQLVALLQWRWAGRGSHLLFEVQRDVVKLLLHVTHDLAFGCRGRKVWSLIWLWYQIVVEDFQYGISIQCVTHIHLAFFTVHA